MYHSHSREHTVLNIAPIADSRASDETTSTGAARLNNGAELMPRWDERLPVAFVFWYMPDSSDPAVSACARART
jgi:hypothetical protein